jgi:hypothetical protein
MEVAITSTTAIKTIEGGLSEFWKFLLECVFFNKSGHDLSKSGICLTLSDGTLLHLWLELHFVIADEAALHYLYGCKGASGLKPCLECSNIFNWRFRARGIVETIRSARYHWTCDFDALVLHDFDSLSAIIRRLQGAKIAMSNEDFQELQTNIGWTLIPNGVMADDECRRRVSRRAVLDAMHILFVQGIFGWCAGQVLSAMKEATMPVANLHAYFSAWRLPKASPSNEVAAAFHPTRLASSLTAGTFKCTASEALGIFPIWAQYCQANAGCVVKDHFACFLSLARVIALWQRRGRGLVTSAEFKLEIVKFLRVYKALYGPDAMALKFHYLLHLPMYPNLACWVHERKHKWVKRHANNVQNTSGEWERSVHREVTTEHIHRLRRLDREFFSRDVGLMEPTTTPGRDKLKLLQRLFGSDVCFTMGKVAQVDKYNEKVTVSDIVLLRAGDADHFGEVLWHVFIEDPSGLSSSTYKSACKMLRLQSAEARVFKLIALDDVQIVNTSDIICALTCAGQAPGIISALKPLHCRNYVNI